MIIRARHNYFIYKFFSLYALLSIKRNFRRVCIDGEIREREAGVLIISNHVSWWDGFWVMYANLKLFRRKFHFMMLEDQLRRFWHFRYTGGFSVRKGSRSVLETLDHACELLSNRGNIVLVFPEGEIQSIYKAPVRFEGGIERIIRQCVSPVIICFAVNLIDYLSDKNPSLYIYLKEFTPVEGSLEEAEREYNKFLSECIEKNIRRADVS
jgi:1-acyl-sn-glycerol-3-phosphate acyltransferase